jgi:hypothetical protein
MKKRFKKISWNERQVALEWTEQRDTEAHDHALTCKDAPLASFDAALQELCDDVLDIAELGEMYSDGMRVQSVSLSLSEKTGARGCVVTAMKTLAIANAPLALHTPHLLAESASNGDEPSGEAEPAKTGVVPDGMWARIERLEKEAWAYLAGKRAPREQIDLLEKSEELEGAGV